MPVRIKFTGTQYAGNPEDITSVIAEITEEWIVPVKEELMKAIKRRKLVSSKELIQSFEHAVAKDLAGRVELDLGFSDHGRIKEIRSRSWNFKAPPVKEIEKWVKKVGLSKFKFVPGYDAGNAPKLSTEKKVNRIARSISRSRLKGNLKVKTRKWYAKNFWSYINQLEGRLMDAIDIEALKQFQNEMKK